VKNARQRSRKVLVNYPYTTTFRQHLSSSWFFDGVSVAHHFSFLCCLLFCLSWYCVLSPILPLSVDFPFLIASPVFATFIYQEEFEDTKGVIRIRKSKKCRQHNGQKENDKMTNNDLQNIHIKLKIE